jgi:hypothetical protein
MAAGFHQIPVHPGSIEKLAFVTPDDQYEYLRMPFGLANAPSIYQRAINTALQSEIQEGIALVYLDDVLIPSITVKKGLANLRKVLTTLQSHGFSINVEKCSFLQTEVEYLSRVISNGEVKPSPSKANVLKAIKPPMNVKEVRQFLELAGYFRKLIPQFSVKARVLSTLLKHDAVWQWSQKHTGAFNDVINILASKPVLTIFNPSLPIELHTDASSKGFGAIIIPIHDDLKKVVAYFSKATTPTESRYHSYELEILAVVSALKHFHQIMQDCAKNLGENKNSKMEKLMNPYDVKCPDYEFFINYGDKNKLKYESILPGTTLKDPVVTDLREIQYPSSGEIYFKIDFDDEYKLLPRRAKNINLRKCLFGNVFSTARKITKKKFEDLQQIKLDCWPFYDALLTM